MDFKENQLANHRMPDSARTSDSGDLTEALHELPVPAGLERRLISNLEAAAVGRTEMQPRHGLPRRRWLQSAACLVGLGLGGRFAYRRRTIAPQELGDAVVESLLRDDWSLRWNEGPPPPDFAYPSEMQAPQGWQWRPLGMAPSTIAFNVSLPGCSAVLFAIKTVRDVSQYSTVPPAEADSRTGVWTKIAIWKSPAPPVVYVLAFRGQQRDYGRFFPGGSVIPLA